MIRDFLIPDYILNQAGYPQWDSRQIQPATLQGIYKSMMRGIAMDMPEADRADAIAWADDSTPHWRRSAVPTMGRAEEPPRSGDSLPGRMDDQLPDD